MTMGAWRPQTVEVWSRGPDGAARLHGRARCLSFADACKQLATESIDFWTHYDRGCYQGRSLHPSRALALAPD